MFVHVSIVFFLLALVKIGAQTRVENVTVEERGESSYFTFWVIK